MNLQKHRSVFILFKKIFIEVEGYWHTDVYAEKLFWKFSESLQENIHSAAFF